MNEIFYDEEGNTSSMNFVWLISIFTIISTWLLLSLKIDSLQHVTEGDALWFTTLFCGKVIQNFYEKKYPSGLKNGGLVQTNKGKFSPARMVWILAVLGIVFTWAYLSWHLKELQHFTTGDAAWFAALFGSKVGGTIVERSVGNNDMYSSIDNYSKDNNTDNNTGNDAEMMEAVFSQNTDENKDKLIIQLQDTIKIQTEFNKNLIDKISL